MSDSRLQIRFERSGGFANIPMSVDSRELPQEEAAELATLVEGVDLPALAGRQPEPGAGRPDRFQYDLAITRGDGSYRLQLREGEVPPELMPLIDRLLDLARRR